MILRRSIAVACALAAVSAVPASAHTKYQMSFVTRTGTQTAARSAAGCTFRTVWFEKLVTTCGRNGHATLTYALTLPRGVGTVYPKVDGWQSCSGQHWVQGVMVRVNARTVHEVIPVPARCTVAINSVRINYLSRW